MRYVEFFFKQKTAYEMRISDWSSEGCSSDLLNAANGLVFVKDQEGNGAPLTVAGIGIYQPVLFKNLPSGQAEPLAPLLHQAISRQQVFGSHHQGSWVDVGTPEQIGRAHV